MKEKKVNILELMTGMILSRSVYDHQGRLLLPADFILTSKAILQLKWYEIEEVYVKELFSEEVVQDFESDRVERIRQTEEFKAFDAAHGQSVEIVREALNNVLFSTAKINASDLLSHIDQIVHVNKNNMQVFDMLHCIREYDDSTYVHSVNVALICNVMGKWLNYPPKDIEVLTLAGLLHDIGKLMMPQEIIKKPSSLSKEEYEVIKTHPKIGCQIIEDESLDPRIKLAILQHHEKCDGSGYPYGIKDKEISAFAKIVAIADVYDAMTANRVYRMGLCPFDVINLFEDQGFDKYDVTDLLIFMEHIVGSYINKHVLLSNGNEAKIIMINKSRLSRPVVVCGQECVDLSKEPSIAILAVL